MRPAPTPAPRRATPGHGRGGRLWPGWAGLLLWAAPALASLLPTTAWAGPVLDRVLASQTLRVCIWPDYYGITWRNPRTQQLSGLDITLSAALAQELGVQLIYVDSSFVALPRDLAQDRCDIAMHAVAVLPSRLQQMRFSRPYLRSDIYAITTRSKRQLAHWRDIDQPGVRVAVQDGTFMRPVMAAALQHAELVVVQPPQSREQELESGRVDVFMTDFAYSRRLLDSADWARLIAPDRPFHVLPYAYALKPGDPAWLARVDAFVSAIKRDGRLLAAARQHGLADIVVQD